MDYNNTEIIKMILSKNGADINVKETILNWLLIQFQQYIFVHLILIKEINYISHQYKIMEFKNQFNFKYGLLLIFY